jgi:hypothetical protein
MPKTYFTTKRPPAVRSAKTTKATEIQERRRAFAFHHLGVLGEARHGRALGGS